MPATNQPSWVLFEHQPQRLIIVDPAVADIDCLLSELSDDTAVAVLRGERTPLQEISEVICSQIALQEISIVAHGFPGGLSCRNGSVTVDDLLSHAGEVQAWRTHFGQDASLNIYGCEAGADKAGSEFVATLERLTGARVAAASTVLGHTATGQNWRLDVRSEDFPVVAPFSATAMQRYAHTLMTPLFGEQLINLYTLGDQLAVEMTTLADGSYIVTWQSFGQDGSAEGIFAQRFSATGQRIGSEFQVNSNPLLGQTEPAVASLADGGYVITWIDVALDGSSWGIFAQRYDAAGNAVGGEFLVNTTTTTTQFEPTVVGLTGGGYVVTWTDSSNSGPDNNGWGILGQVYDAAGNAVGGEMICQTEAERLPRW